MKFAKVIQLAVSMTVATTSAEWQQGLLRFTEKGGMLRALNQAAKKKKDKAAEKKKDKAAEKKKDQAAEEPTGIQCDIKTEYKCLSERYETLSCVARDGVCTCPEGLTRCDGLSDAAGNQFCRELCCEPGQETCTDAAMKVISCGNPEDGGCTCPDPLTKQNKRPIGMLCVCKGENLKTCYGATLDTSSIGCAEDCACPEGKKECIIDHGKGYADSYCLEECCHLGEEEMCLDSDGNFICSSTGEECAGNTYFFDMQKTRKNMLGEAKEFSIE